MSIATKLDPILEVVIPAVRRAERFLGPEDDWVEDDRRILFEAAQRHLGDVHQFLRKKTAREYVTTVHASPDAVERALMPPYQRNLVSTRKYREHHDGGRQWACGSFVVHGLDSVPSEDSERGASEGTSDSDGDHGYEEQHHVYLFEAPNGGTDVYAHRETAASEGAEHLTDTNQNKADPHKLFDIFDRAGFEYGRRKELSK